MRFGALVASVASGYFTLESVNLWHPLQATIYDSFSPFNPYGAWFNSKADFGIINLI